MYIYICIFVSGTEALHVFVTTHLLLRMFIHSFIHSFLVESRLSQVEVEEFLMGCLRLRGPATAIDMGKVIRDQNWLVQTLGSLVFFFSIFH